MVHLATSLLWLVPPNGRLLIAALSFPELQSKLQYFLICRLGHVLLGLSPYVAFPVELTAEAWPGSRLLLILLGP